VVVCEDAIDEEECNRWSNTNVHDLDLFTVEIYGTPPMLPFFSANALTLSVDYSDGQKQVSQAQFIAANVVVGLAMDLTVKPPLKPLPAYLQLGDAIQSIRVRELRQCGRGNIASMRERLQSLMIPKNFTLGQPHADWAVLRIVGQERKKLLARSSLLEQLTLHVHRAKPKRLSVVMQRRLSQPGSGVMGIKLESDSYSTWGWGGSKEKKSVSKGCSTLHVTVQHPFNGQETVVVLPHNTPVGDLKGGENMISNVKSSWLRDKYSLASNCCYRNIQEPLALLRVGNTVQCFLASNPGNPGYSNSTECKESPANWKDSSKSSCAQYKTNKWCTDTGGYGTGWNTFFSSNTFAKYAVNSIDASQACCECGGGFRDGTVTDGSAIQDGTVTDGSTTQDGTVTDGSTTQDGTVTDDSTSKTTKRLYFYQPKLNLSTCRRCTFERFLIPTVGKQVGATMGVDYDWAVANKCAANYETADEKMEREWRMNGTDWWKKQNK
jgi:hypothetical protein